MTRCFVVAGLALFAACFNPTDVPAEADTSGATEASTSGGPGGSSGTLTSTTDDTSAGPGTTVDPDTSAGSSSDGTTSPSASCGDAMLDSGEECDDGNDVVGDGCSAACVDETIACDTALVGGVNTFAVGRMIASGASCTPFPASTTIRRAFCACSTPPIRPPPRRSPPSR